jgi:hypothetical protein
MGCVSARRAPRKRRRLLRLLLFPLVILLGCSPSLGRKGLGVQRTVDARELYRDPAFSREDIEREGVTCLVARLSFGHETYGHALVQELAETMQEQLTDRKVVHPNVVASHINQAGLARDYATMITAYDKTNILDRETLHKIAEAVGARYFVVPILVNFREGDITRLSIFGVRLAKTAWATARFQLQIWDSRSGRIVWEGISDLTLAQELLRERPVRFEDTIQATWESIIEKIPLDSALPTQTEGPA